jgi:hypothetical protein
MLVKIDIDEDEIKAIDALLKDCKVPPEMGWTLTNLKKKIYESWKKEFDAKQKELAKQLIEGEKDARRKPDKKPDE